MHKGIALLITGYGLIFLFLSPKEITYAAESDLLSAILNRQREINEEVLKLGERMKLGSNPEDLGRQIQQLNDETRQLIGYANRLLFQQQYNNFSPAEADTLSKELNIKILSLQKRDKQVSQDINRLIQQNAPYRVRLAKIQEKGGIHDELSALQNQRLALERIRQGVKPDLASGEKEITAAMSKQLSRFPGFRYVLEDAGIIRKSTPASQPQSAPPQSGPRPSPRRPVPPPESMRERIVRLQRERAGLVNLDGPRGFLERCQGGAERGLWLLAVCGFFQETADQSYQQKRAERFGRELSQIDFLKRKIEKEVREITRKRTVGQELTEADRRRIDELNRLYNQLSEQEDKIKEQSPTFRPRLFGIF